MPGGTRVKIRCKSTHQTNLSPVFTQQESDAAKGFIQHVMAKTPAIYMMANQLPLIGLSYASIYARSDDSPKPYFELFSNVPMSDVVAQGGSNGSGPNTTVPSPTPTSRGVANACDTALSELAVERQTADANNSIGALNIVAFSDPNDLLSWGIPAWYLQEPACVPNLHITNVFVGNTTRWAGIYEDPVLAHRNYFINDQVWRVIRCGAQDGKLAMCPP